MNKTKGNKKGLSLALRQNIVGYSFILPNFIGFFIFTFIPVIFSLLLSFSHWDGFTEMEFAGLDNFIKNLKTEFLYSLSGKRHIFLSSPCCFLWWRRWGLRCC